jgi:hypothetical protein
VARSTSYLLAFPNAFEALSPHYLLFVITASMFLYHPTYSVPQIESPKRDIESTSGSFCGSSCLCTCSTSRNASRSGVITSSSSVSSSISRIVIMVFLIGFMVCPDSDISGLEYLLYYVWYVLWISVLQISIQSNQ